MNVFQDYFKIDGSVVGLSPMDGITDAPYRYIVKKYGNPDLIITEFVNVNALAVGNTPVYTPFLYDEIERPVIAQIYGSEPKLFYAGAIIAAELGFDGVDINMGCPAKNVANSGAGAALIRTPEVAKEIVKSVKKGIADWQQGKTYRDLEIKQRNKEIISTMIRKPAERRELPVSVKTRVGYADKVTTEWVKHLEEVEPAWISIHGRTLKQMYKGEADWEEIAKAVQVSSITPILGNGDINSSDTAVKRIKATGIAGVLIGRASFGNPWIFKQKREIKKLSSSIIDYQPSIQETKKVILDHCRKFTEYKSEPRLFVEMRKHLSWYIKGFPGAKETRVKLMQTSSIEDVIKVLEQMK